MPDPIRHVVVLMLENHSFDQMLGCFKSINSAVDGVDPTHPFCNPGLHASSSPVCQAECTTRSMQKDPDHNLANVLRQITGPCLGFVSDFVQTFPQSSAAERAQIMGYFPRGFLPALHALADNFTICDRWFSSLPGPTWPNRFFVHSGTSLGHVTMPNGIWHPDIHLYDQATLYDRLEEKQITWKIYYGDVPHSLVLLHQLQYPFHYHHMDQFFSDAQGNGANFPQYSFIEPHYFEDAQNDQHPPTDILKGDVLLAQVYNAIRANEQLWNSTLVVVLYDEHGGFADHVKPPYGPPLAVPPDGHVSQYAFNQLGVRIPALLVSPWTAADVVHETFDHTSLLRYATDKWELGDLGHRTAAANSFARAIASNARTNTPVSIPVAQIVPTAARISVSSRELNPNQAALIAFTNFLETKLAQVEPKESVARRTLAATAASPTDQAAVARERVEAFLQYRRKGLI